MKEAKSSSKLDFVWAGLIVDDFGPPLVVLVGVGTPMVDFIGSLVDSESLVVASVADSMALSMRFIGN